MEYNTVDVNKICRICLEEGVLTSIFNTEFAMMPSDMIMLCAKIRVYKNDGLPSVICNNCIYRLGAAYHFKQQCENSDLRLRNYLGLLDKGFGTRDNETNTDNNHHSTIIKPRLADYGDDEDEEDDEDDDENNLREKKLPKRARNRYKRKLPEDRKKRGPKPQLKVSQTCYECNKTFKCAAQLMLHIRTHTGERPFVCSYCSRRFAQKHNLAIHIRTHTGERPFQCEICSKQFAALGNFQAHKKIHAGIRDQICPVCNKSFITSGDLARHMITHTGIKNHHCDICGKSFSRNRDMVAHKKKIHLSERLSLEQYKCRECHKVFATSISLSTHYRIHEPPPSQQQQQQQQQQQTNTIISMPIAPTAIGGSMGGGGGGGGGSGGIIGGVVGSTVTGMGVSNIGLGIGLPHHHHHHHPHHPHTMSQTSSMSTMPPPLPPPPPPPMPSTGLGGMLGSHSGMMHHHHHHHSTQRLHPF